MRKSLRSEKKSSIYSRRGIMDKEMVEKAYRDYLYDLDRTRNEILSKLITIRNDEKKDTYVKWLNQAIEFIAEVR